MAERGGALVLAQPTALAAAKLTKKLYMPTALVHERLPAGLGELRSVPQLMDSMAESAEDRLQEYCCRIRCITSASDIELPAASPPISRRAPITERRHDNGWDRGR